MEDLEKRTSSVEISPSASYKFQKSFSGREILINSKDNPESQEREVIHEAKHVSNDIDGLYVGENIKNEWSAEAARVKSSVQQVCKGKDIDADAYELAASHHNSTTFANPLSRAFQRTAAYFRHYGQNGNVPSYMGTHILEIDAIIADVHASLGNTSATIDTLRAVPLFAKNAQLLTELKNVADPEGKIQATDIIRVMARCCNLV